MRQGAHITRTMSLQATPAWWVERVLPMAAVATRISTFGHGSTITSDSGGTPVCGFICTEETGKNR